MTIGDVTQLTVKGTVGGQDHVHTLHFRYLSGTAAEGLLIDAWQAAAEASFRALFPTVNTPQEMIEARQVCGVGPLRAPIQETPGAQTGTRVVSGDMSPTFLAELVGERTALAGRSRRGRFFLGGLWEIDHDGNDLRTVAGSRYLLTTTYANALGAAFGGGGTSTDYRLVVWSRKLASVPGAVCADAWADVISFTHPTLLSTMRSRRPGHGG